ncbi:GntR family transcriptional regulator [Bosea thiooxidans]|uniref:DNA-binding transcriptional regulator, GntR family n=1 Tax=Bosea thiooxidans TaxID=53254 RepID=A0A0Q3I9Q5_9HYPH|nr:GntR family transcriptional regulator [Bosea thiooxidans]KQK31735.1 GntR family transcriptional regulator [Bosea thiooxidans]SKB57765.1 DNA-binding transcriptional regulator, GntR family [Bosea thiooxidans]
MADAAADGGGEEVAALSTGEQAYERIRQDIVFGRLQPGQRLTLDKLRPVYGVGISTLREILSRLVPEGLVVAEGQRGFQVAPCTASELAELAELRLLIESHALAQSFAAGDMEWEGRVVAAHHKLARMEERLLAGDDSGTMQWKRYDFEFHQALVSACGSKALLDLHAGIYERYLRYQMVFFIFWGPTSIGEHRALLDCALRRDADEGRRLLHGHIQGCVDVALERRLLD